MSGANGVPRSGRSGGAGGSYAAEQRCADALVLP